MLISSCYFSLSSLSLSLLFLSFHYSLLLFSPQYNRFLFVCLVWLSVQFNAALPDSMCCHRHHRSCRHLSQPLTFFLPIFLLFWQSVVCRWQWRCWWTRTISVVAVVLLLVVQDRLHMFTSGLVTQRPTSSRQTIIYSESRKNPRTRNSTLSFYVFRFFSPRLLFIWISFFLLLSSYNSFDPSSLWRCLFYTKIGTCL